MADWCSRPLDEIYAAIFIDATWFNPIATQLSLRPMTGQLQSRRPRPDLGAIMARTGRRGRQSCPDPTIATSTEPDVLHEAPGAPYSIAAHADSAI